MLSAARLLYGGKGYTVNVYYLLLGCVYKGTLVYQGQKFDDGCDYTCECLDNVTGKYRCNKKYVTIDLLGTCTCFLRITNQSESSNVRKNIHFY